MKKFLFLSMGSFTLLGVLNAEELKIAGSSTVYLSQLLWLKNML